MDIAWCAAGGGGGGPWLLLGVLRVAAVEGQGDVRGSGCDGRGVGGGSQGGPVAVTVAETRPSSHRGSGNLPDDG